MERRDLYENDIIEERQPPGEQREDVAETLQLDPQFDDSDQEPEAPDDATPKPE
jgi:hypothetical protein